MPHTINMHGFDFDLADEDAEILDVRYVDPDELLDYCDGDLAERGLVGKSDADLERWARDEFARDVQDRVDWTLWPLHEQYGVRQYGPPC